MPVDGWSITSKPIRSVLNVQKACKNVFIQSVLHNYNNNHRFFEMSMYDYVHYYYCDLVFNGVIIIVI